MDSADLSKRGRGSDRGLHRILASGRDFTLAALTRAASPARKARGSLLVPPAPPGSLGDEAMVVATLNALAERGISGVAMVGPDDGRWSECLGPVESLDVKRLLPARGRQILDPVRRLSRYSRLFVLGADVVDGSYGPHANPARALQLLRLAALAGLDCRLLGFSYSSRAAPWATDRLRRLPRGVQLLVRDPRSLARLAPVVGGRARLVADVAFLLEPAGLAERAAAAFAWIAEQRALGRLIVAVNLNSFFVSDFASPDAMIATYKEALEAVAREACPIAVLSVGHDRRGGVSDMTLAERFCEAIAPRIPASCLPEGVTAGEVRAASALVDLALSGRMHVTIGCMAVGTPVASITYQEKFEGLYEMWGLSDLWIDRTAAGDPRQLCLLVRRLLARRSEVAETLRSGRGEIVRLARLNFEGVGDAAGRERGS